VGLRLKARLVSGVTQKPRTMSMSIILTYTNSKMYTILVASKI